MAQPMERAPFFALMGPKRTVWPGEIVRGLQTCYRKVIVERDGLKAMDALNNIVDPDDDKIFRIYNCEELFRRVWDWYLEGTSTEELIAPRIEEAVQKRRTEERLSMISERRFRAYIRNYILNYPARFEESRRHLFMIDLYPGNASRFNLVLTPSVSAHPDS